ncbi:carbohydrate ABC transporter permease [Clostridium sp. Marseille-P2415]|uniref:carbohydrate ABC transporter permease n=1 Tax=Clostridium sp. Marseille-P2415 TaxID=1805471 RepID=UPI00098878F2|nr:sugar ABC transporter permease [Clostridium sp. Marseille-P2415]
MKEKIQSVSSYKRKSALTPYGFIAPAALTILLLVVYPILYGIYISFFDTNLVNKWSFTGLKYYIKALTDSSFLHSLLKTLIFTVTVVSGHFIFGFIFASILNMKIKMRTLFRGILILPWLFPDVVIAYLFKWILNTQGGIINELLLHYKLVSAPIGWLSTSATAFPCVILVSIWKGYPLVMVQVLAGIQTISNDMYEAAKIDGANAWQKFRFITIPALKPILTTILILDTVWVFKQFTMIWLMTSGGPGSSTMVSAIEIYKNAFSYFKYGFASAQSVYILVICYLIGVVFRRLLRDD